MAKERFDERENPAARVATDDVNGQVDEDFFALHKLVNGAKLTGDAEVKMLRDLVNSHNSQRLHAALDKVLNRIRERRRCAGDRAFLRKLGVRS